MSATTARFATVSHAQIQRGQHGDLKKLVEPLPATLAALLPQKVRREHEQLVGRTEKARAAAAAAAAAVEAAREADREERVAAAQTGRKPGALTTPAAEAARDEAVEVASAHEVAFARSADGLLELALPKAEAATAQVEQAIGEERQRQRQLVQDAIAAGDHAAALETELAWLRRLDGATRVQPFAAGGRPSTALDRGLAMALREVDEEERRQAERLEQQRREQAFLAASEQRAAAAQATSSPARVAAE